MATKRQRDRETERQRIHKYRLRSNIVDYKKFKKLLPAGARNATRISPISPRTIFSPRLETVL